MKAYVYVVKSAIGWQAGLTISPAVDWMYWFNGHLLHGQDVHFLSQENSGQADSGWLWKMPLPLGQAHHFVQRWAKWKISRGSYSANNIKRGVLSDHDALERLALIIQEACDERDEGGWFKRQFVSRLDKGGRTQVRAGWLREQVERWERVREERAPYVVVKRMFDDAKMRELAAKASLVAELMQGRALLSGEAHALLEATRPTGTGASWNDASQLAALLGRVRLCGSVAANGGRSGAAKRRCLRCGSGEAQMRRTACMACGRICAYCEACLTMGRSRECELLIIGSYHSPLEDRNACVRPIDTEAPQPNIEERLERWKLSPAQGAATSEALAFIEGMSRQRRVGQRREGQKRRDQRYANQFLLWAVTGAGKTEMIFPLVESVLQRGGKALIATPRRDVVIELDPRIRKAFPQAEVVTLHGDSEYRWERGDITLATTHQLLRFQEGFDLVIIDELDAFPFRGDPMLQYAADKCGLRGTPRMLLSATPPLELQRAARRGRLMHARVPVRYHRYPLPVPKLIRTKTVKQLLASQQLPSALLKALRHSLQRGAQIFVFVQRIAQSEPMAAMLRLKLSHSAVEATSSKDPQRADKVQRFRRADIRILVTTTILERGVTIPKSDVYIMDADGRLFNEASLVQMAGRAGRSSEDPNGRVYFCSSERNRAQLQAVSHIKGMNRMARRRGYLRSAKERAAM